MYAAFISSFCEIFAQECEVIGGVQDQLTCLVVYGGTWNNVSKVCCTIGDATPQPTVTPPPTPTPGSKKTYTFLAEESFKPQIIEEYPTEGFIVKLKFASQRATGFDTLFINAYVGAYVPEADNPYVYWLAQRYITSNLGGGACLDFMKEGFFRWYSDREYAPAYDTFLPVSLEKLETTNEEGFLYTYECRAFAGWGKEELDLVHEKGGILFILVTEIKHAKTLKGVRGAVFQFVQP